MSNQQGSHSAPTSVTKLAFELNDGTAFEISALPGRLDSDLHLTNDLIQKIRFDRFPMSGKQRIDLKVGGEIEQMVVAVGGRELALMQLKDRVAELEVALREIAAGNVLDRYEDRAEQLQDMARTALRAGQA